MNLLSTKLNLVLQASIAVFAIALFWFSFIYYPKMTYDLQSGRVLPRPTIFKPVNATSGTFPIQTSTYRVVYQPGSGNYYAFINGRDLEEFVYNRDNAKLVLKSALSVDKLCGFNVIYVTTQKLQIPQKYLDNSDC